MILTQLTYFEALAREQHFGRAAASCYVSTSTLSEAIRKLETEVGFPLVNRGKSAFQGITDEGRIVLGYARRILAEERSLTQDLTHRRGNLQATVRFGTIPSGTDVAADILSALVSAHPGVHVDMVSGLTSEEIITRVRDHELDAGVVHPLTDRRPRRTDGPLTFSPLGTTRFVVAGRPSLLEHLGETVTGVDLESVPLALLSRGMVAREGFDRATTDAGLDITPGAEATSVESLLALAATGSWVAVVPAPAVEATQLASRPLVAPEVRLDLALVRLDSRPTPVLSAAVHDAAAASRG